MPDERAEAADAGGDRLAGLRMLANLARQREEFHGEIQLHVGGRGILRNACALRLFAFGVIVGLAELDVGSEAARLHRDIEAALRILAKNAVAACIAIGGEGTGVAALGVVGAADERAELACLEVQLSGAAGRALARIAAVLARRIDVRPEHIVEHVEHFGNANILDVIDHADEVVPEILQDLLPRHFVVRDAIELLLEIGGEVVFDIAREEVFQKRDDDATLVFAVEPLLFQFDVTAILEHLQDRGVGGGSADAEFLHALDQRRFREARRRLGEMLGDAEVLALQRFAFAHGGKATAVVVFLIVAAFLV